MPYVPPEERERIKREVSIQRLAVKGQARCAARRKRAPLTAILAATVFEL